MKAKLQFEFFCNVTDLFNFSRELCEQGVFDICVLKEKLKDRLAVTLIFWRDGKMLSNIPKNKLILQDIGDYWESRHPNNEWGGNWFKEPGDFLDLNLYRRSM